MKCVLLACAVFVSLVTVPAQAGNNVVIRQSVRQPLFRRNTTVVRQQVIRQPVVRQQVVVPLVAPQQFIVPSHQFILPQQFIVPQQFILPHSYSTGAAIILR